MSLFEPNTDAYRMPSDEASAGKLMGFLDAFDASWEAQTRVHGLMSVQQGFREVEQGQIRRMREAGLRPPKSLDESDDNVPDFSMGDVSGFGGFARDYSRYLKIAQAIAAGQPPEIDDAIRERSDMIEVAKKNRPDLGLLSYAEMFDQVRARAKEAEHAAQGPTTTLGAVGGFVGSALGSMNPETDPLNFALGIVTAPIGGPGGVLGRMATQGVIQGATEAGNVLFGPDNQFLLFGKPETVGQKAARIGLSTAGGALVQGVGEAAAFGGRKIAARWFNDLPEPPAPAPAKPAEMFGPATEGEVLARMKPGQPINDYPNWETFATAHGYDATPYGKTRDAAIRTASDLDNVASQLNRWDGPLPYEMRPRGMDTSAAAIEGPDRGVVFDKPYTRYVDSLDTVDDIARRVDPDLFRQYDKLAADRQMFRDEIAKLDRNIEDHRNAEEVLRRGLMKADERMRDLAPLVSRAYAQAEKEWRSTKLDFDTLRFLKQLEDRTGWRFRGEDKPSLTEQPAKVAPLKQPPVYEPTVGDAVPAAKLSPELEARVKLDANADAPTRVAAATAENAKVRDEKIDSFMSTAKKFADMTDAELKEAQGNAAKQLAKAKTPKEKAIAQREHDELHYVTMPDGSKLHLTQDKVPFVEPDGTAREVSVRDFLREMDKDQQALQSVITCSRPS